LGYPSEDRRAEELVSRDFPVQTVIEKLTQDQRQLVPAELPLRVVRSALGPRYQVVVREICVRLRVTTLFQESVNRWSVRDFQQVYPLKRSDKIY